MKDKFNKIFKEIRRSFIINKKDNVGFNKLNKNIWKKRNYITSILELNRNKNRYHLYFSLIR